MTAQLGLLWPGRGGQEAEETEPQFAPSLSLDTGNFGRLTPPSQVVGPLWGRPATSHCTRVPFGASLGQFVAAFWGGTGRVEWGVEAETGAAGGILVKFLILQADGSVSCRRTDCVDSCPHPIRIPGQCCPDCSAGNSLWGLQSTPPRRRLGLPALGLSVRSRTRGSSQVILTTAPWGSPSTDEETGSDVENWPLAGPVWCCRQMGRCGGLTA